MTFSPADNATITDNTSNIVLTFSEAVYSDASETVFTETTIGSLVTLKETNSSGDDIDFTGSIASTGDNLNKVITVNPDANLPDGDVYVELAASFYDIDGVVGTSTNITFKLDSTAPTVSTKKVAGKYLNLTMSEDLDSTSIPAASRFTVGVSSGTPPTVSSVSYSNKIVSLVLSSEVTSTQIVTLTYTAPTGNNATPLKDVAGNLLANFSGTSVTNSTATGPTISWSPADNSAHSTSQTVVLTFNKIVYSDAIQTAFTNSSAKSILTLKEDDSSGDAITFTVATGTASSNTKTTFTITATEVQGGFTDGIKYVSISDAFFDADGNQGSSVNIDFEIDLTAPAYVAADSGVFDDLATTTAFTGTAKQGDDIYFRIAFNDVMKYVAGSGSTRRPVLSYWYDDSSVQGWAESAFEIVASTAVLGHEECQPMGSIAGYPAGSRYVCRYTVPADESGSIGL